MCCDNHRCDCDDPRQLTVPQLVALSIDDAWTTVYSGDHPCNGHRWHYAPNCEGGVVALDRICTRCRLMQEQGIYDDEGRLLDAYGRPVEDDQAELPTPQMPVAREAEAPLSEELIPCD